MSIPKLPAQPWHVSCTRNRERLGLALLLVLALVSPARAELRFVEPIAHAGTVYAGARLVHEFAFENEGPETVEILTVRAGCGCLTPRLEQSTYRPGEKGSITLEVNTLSQAAGPHTWAVTVRYQSGSSTQERILRLNARLVTEVSVQPAALIVFADKLAQHELVLTDSRAKSLSVLDVQPSSTKLFARLREPLRDAQGPACCKISLAVAEDYPDGRHEEMLTIHTDDARYRDLHVPVTIIKRAPQEVTATPSQIELIAPAGQPFPARMVLIRAQDGQGVHIDEIVADDPALVCQWAPGPGVLATLRIRAERKLNPGESFQSAVHVRIDQPVRQTLSIPVTCTIR